MQLARMSQVSGEAEPWMTDAAARHRGGERTPTAACSTGPSTDSPIKPSIRDGNLGSVHWLVLNESLIKENWLVESFASLSQSPGVRTNTICAHKLHPLPVDHWFMPINPLIWNKETIQLFVWGVKSEISTILKRKTLILSEWFDYFTSSGVETRNQSRKNMWF